VLLTRHNKLIFYANINFVNKLNILTRLGSHIRPYCLKESYERIKR